MDNLNNEDDNLIKESLEVAIEEYKKKIDLLYNHERKEIKTLNDKIKKIGKVMEKL